MYFLKFVGGKISSFELRMKINNNFLVFRTAHPLLCPLHLARPYVYHFVFWIILLIAKQQHYIQSQSNNIIYNLSQSNNIIYNQLQSNNIIYNLLQSNNIIYNLSQSNNIIYNLSQSNNIIDNLLQSNNIIYNVLPKQQHYIQSVAKQQHYIQSVTKQQHYIQSVAKQQHYIQSVTKQQHYIQSVAKQQHNIQSVAKQQHNITICRKATTLYTICHKATTLYTICRKATTLYTICRKATTLYTICSKATTLYTICRKATTLYTICRKSTTLYTRTLTVFHLFKNIHLLPTLAREIKICATHKIYVAIIHFKYWTDYDPSTVCWTCFNNPLQCCNVVKVPCNLEKPQDSNLVWFKLFLPNSRVWIQCSKTVTTSYIKFNMYLWWQASIQRVQSEHLSLVSSHQYSSSTYNCMRKFINNSMYWKWCIYIINNTIWSVMHVLINFRFIVSTPMLLPLVT